MFLRPPAFWPSGEVFSFIDSKPRLDGYGTAATLHREGGLLSPANWPPVVHSGPGVGQVISRCMGVVLQRLAMERAGTTSPRAVGPRKWGKIRVLLSLDLRGRTLWQGFADLQGTVTPLRIFWPFPTSCWIAMELRMDSLATTALADLCPRAQKGD